MKVLPKLKIEEEASEKTYKQPEPDPNDVMGLATGYPVHSQSY